MADTQKNPFVDMFQNFGEKLNIPAPDVSNMMDMHRKNLQALQAVTSIGTSSAQAVMEKQRAALEEALADIAETVQGAAKGGGDANQIMTAPMDLAKRSFDAALRNAADVAETVQKGNMDAIEVLKERMTESMQELTGKKPE